MEVGRQDRRSVGRTGTLGAVDTVVARAEDDRPERLRIRAELRQAGVVLEPDYIEEANLPKRISARSCSWRRLRRGSATTRRATSTTAS